MSERARASLLETDRRWAALAAEGERIDQIVGFWADDAKLYPPGMPVVAGKTAIRAFVTEVHRVPGSSVTWEPEDVVVSGDATMACTAGSNRFTAVDAQGKSSTTLGRYLTVWRRNADGEWRCVVDMWNAGPA